MQGTHTHIPETNCVPREYSVAAILLFLFMVLISLVSVLNLLYFYISTFRSMCAAHNMAVFCRSLTSWFAGMLLTYFLNDFEIVPVALITGIIIIIIIIIIISFMQGTHTHIPETNYVPREHGVAAILLFLFMVLISLLAVLNLLYFYISTFRSMFIIIIIPRKYKIYFSEDFQAVPARPSGKGRL